MIPEEQKFRSQIEEMVSRRDYDAALQFAVRQADAAYARHLYQQAASFIAILLEIYRNHDVTQWKLLVVAYRKLVALDNQVGDSTATVRDLVSLGRVCVRDGDFDTALAACDSAVNLEHRNIDALNQKARVLAYKRQYAEAFAVLEQSLAISEDNPRTLFLKAGILANDGRFSEALKVYEQVRLLNPSYPELGRVIAEIKRELDWKAKAVEGASVTSVHTEHSESDTVPAIERKARSGKEEQQEQPAEDYLQRLYDEAVGEGQPSSSSGAAQQETGNIPAAESQSAGPAMETIELPQELEHGREQDVATPAVPEGSPAMDILLPAPVQSEASALTPPPFSAQHTVVQKQQAVGEADRAEMEEQLICILKDLDSGTLKADSLTERLAAVQGVQIPLALGILFLNFFHAPQDMGALEDLLTWLADQHLSRLPLYVLDYAVATGVTLETTSPVIGDVLLHADPELMSSPLRAQRAELLLAQGDTAGYVGEELAALRAAAPGVSREAVVRQMEQILGKCSDNPACVQSILDAAAGLGVQDQVMERIAADPVLSGIPAFEEAVVTRLEHEDVDESSFLEHEALFQRVTFGPEKAAILRRILAKAVNPTVRHKALQCLLVLATPNSDEISELVGLMAKDHDTTNAMYVLQYMVDHHADIENGRFLLERLGKIITAGYEDRFGLGLAADALQEPELAAGFYCDALRAHPGDPDATKHAVAALVAAHDYDLLEDVAGLSHLTPDQLETVVDAALAVMPEGTDPGSAKLVSAWTSYVGGRYEEAVAAASSTVRAGGDPQFYLPMALSFVKLGLPELAVRELDRGLRSPAIDARTRIALMYHSAVIQLSLGNTAQAAHLLQEVREQAPEFRDVDTLLSKCGSEGARILNF